MMELTLTTPALLFPAISLLLLAYTNRFLVLAQLVRELHSRYKEEPHDTIEGQINNLNKRIRIIRNMQVLGVGAFFLCVLCMFLIFAGLQIIAEIVFGISLIMLMSSLGLSLYEIQISVHALTLQLSETAKRNKE